MKPPAQPSHNRKLALIGTAMTNARNPKQSMMALNQVREELEPIIIASGYCNDTSFSWVTLSIRYGMEHGAKPAYQAISEKYGDLPLAIEVPTEEMRGASLLNLKQLFRSAALRALIHAGEKYERPVEPLKTLLESQA